MGSKLFGIDGAFDDHPGQQYFDFAIVPNHERSWERPSFEEEYLSIPGETREEAETSWEAIGDGNEGEVTPHMREWFFKKQGWYAPDSTVFKTYWTYHDNIADKRIGLDKEAHNIVKDMYSKEVMEAFTKKGAGKVTLVTPGKVELVTDKQIGGDHYKNMAITPTKYIEANDISWSEGNVIKYISRHQSKNGRQDVEKALHYCELILKGYDEAERLHANTH